MWKYYFAGEEWFKIIGLVNEQWVECSKILD
jgi:hypothetical protein